MTRTDVQTVASSSRLVRFLAGLGVEGAAIPPKHFVERLGQLYDLPASIRISALHSRSPATPAEAGAVSREEVKAQFLRARAGIVSGALQSFAPGGGSPRLRFPLAMADLTDELARSPGPYLAFYAKQQNDIDFKIRNLQARTREAIAALSPELAQLAALDAALGDPLAIHNRRIFSAVGELLRRRIEQLLDEYHRAQDGAAQENRLWAATLAQLRIEMQELLLAEIETRLLPTLGLIEALDEPDHD